MSAIPYKIIRSPRRRRSISLSVIEGGVVVRAPLKVPERVIDSFVSAKSIWISKQLTNKTSPTLPPRERVAKLNKYRLSLNRRLALRLPELSAAMSCYYTSYRVRNVRSYWGTCNASAVLSFNIKLGGAPSQVIDYVIIHELAHIKFKGHGKRFWQYVSRFDPQYVEHKKWLRVNHRKLDF